MGNSKEEGKQRKQSKWITPFVKQCFVTSGISINNLSHGMTFGFASLLFLQLKRSKEIPLDDDTESTIASIVGPAFIIGNTVVACTTKRFGRRTFNFISATIMTISFLIFTLATNVTTLMIARLLQGTSIGLISFLGPILIGEYATPKRRGAFISTVSFCFSSGALFIHIIGTFLSWQRTALAAAVIMFIDVLIIINSPESPTFLASHGKYDECRKVFRWLRGNDEEEELEKIIKADMILKASVTDGKPESILTKIKKKIETIRVIGKKKEFYKPVILIAHVYTVNQWCGMSILQTYAADIYHILVGDAIDMSIIILSADIGLIFAGSLAILIVMNARRRVTFLISVSNNIFAFLLIAAYSYAKTHKFLPYDHPYIGFFLIHYHIFSIAIGPVPVANTLLGEVFPLEYKGFGGMIAVLAFSLALTINVKSTPFLISSIGLHGTYVISACVVGWCLIVAWILLPETKDRTLLDIEEDFRGKPLVVLDKDEPSPLIQGNVDGNEA